MVIRRLLVACTDDSDGAQEQAFAAARRGLVAGDEVVLLGSSTPEGIARAAVHEDAALVVVAGSSLDVEAVVAALRALAAQDVDVVAADATATPCDAPDGPRPAERG